MEWNPAVELDRFGNRVTFWKFAWLSGVTLSMLAGSMRHTVHNRHHNNRHHNLKERGKSLWDENKKDTWGKKNKFSRNNKFCLSLEGRASVEGNISTAAGKWLRVFPCFHLRLSAVYYSNCTFLINDWICYLHLMSLTCCSSPTRKRSKTSSRWD